MAKAKGKKGSGGGVNSHLRSRLAYLYQAATYLQSTARKSGAPGIDTTANGADPKIMSDRGEAMPLFGSSAISEKRPQVVERDQPFQQGPLPQLSRTFISHMRGVSLKSQLRLPIEQKRSFCKRCDTRLIPGTNCTQEIRNLSRGSKKPWADVRVVRCTTCGTEKRFPQTEKRSKKLTARGSPENRKKDNNQQAPVVST